MLEFLIGYLFGAGNCNCKENNVGKISQKTKNNLDVIISIIAGVGIILVLAYLAFIVANAKKINANLTNKDYVRRKKSQIKYFKNKIKNYKQLIDWSTQNEHNVF